MGKKLFYGKALLFDADNTLFDFAFMKMRSIYVAVKEMRKYGMPIDVKTAFRNIFEVYNQPGKGWEHKTVFQEFLKDFSFENLTLGQLNTKKVWLEAGILAYRKEKSHIIAPYDGIRLVLNFLKGEGFPLGILTDAPEDKVRERLLETKLLFRQGSYTESLFKFIITPDIQNPDGSALLKADGNPMDLRKPSSDFFKLAVTAMGVEPELILHTGDSYAKDMEGAKSVGMKTALAKWGLRSTCEDLEFLEFLEEVSVDLNSMQKETLSKIARNEIPAVDYCLDKVMDLNKIVRLLE